ILASVRSWPPVAGHSADASGRRLGLEGQRPTVARAHRAYPSPAPWRLIGCPAYALEKSGREHQHLCIRPLPRPREVVPQLATLRIAQMSDVALEMMLDPVKDQRRIHHDCADAAIYPRRLGRGDRDRRPRIIHDEYLMTQHPIMSHTASQLLV